MHLGSFMPNFYDSAKKVSDLPVDVQSQFRDLGHGFVKVESFELYESVQDPELLHAAGLREGVKLRPIDLLHVMALQVGSESGSSLPDYLQSQLEDVATAEERIRQIVKRGNAEVSSEDVERIADWFAQHPELDDDQAD